MQELATTDKHTSLSKKKIVVLFSNILRQGYQLTNFPFDEVQMKPNVTKTTLLFNVGRLKWYEPVPRSIQQLHSPVLPI